MTLVEDVARLRRMTNEPTQSPYSDALLQAYIEAWELVDTEGRTSANDGWTASYDLHATASEIWEEKAAVVHAKHDFSADGANYSSNQIYENCMDQARYHAARAKIKTRKEIQLPTASSSDLGLGLYANIDPPLDDDWEWLND